MSEEYRMIRVEAPRMLLDHEKMTVKGLSCGYCHGNGYFWGMDDMGQSVKDPCRICKGSGKVNAEITINYKPFKNNHYDKDF